MHMIAVTQASDLDKEDELITLIRACEKHAGFDALRFDQLPVQLPSQHPGFASPSESGQDVFLMDLSVLYNNLGVLYAREALFNLALNLFTVSFCML